MLRFRIDATAVATATVVLIVPAALAEPLVFAPWGGPQHSAFHQLTPERDAVAAPDKTNPVPARLKRQIVSYQTKEAPGTIVIDTPNTRLLYVLRSGEAISYGIGVGREGFTWSGVQTISRKSEWPDWIPPEEMLRRQPYLPRFMAGGAGNPMGARAMYIGATVYRVHGTNAPETIGHSVSSGCFRLVNSEIEDLYQRVPVGTKIVVQHR